MKMDREFVPSYLREAREWLRWALETISEDDEPKAVSHIAEAREQLTKAIEELE